MSQTPRLKAIMETDGHACSATLAQKNQSKRLAAKPVVSLYVVSSQKSQNWQLGKSRI